MFSIREGGNHQRFVLTGIRTKGINQLGEILNRVTFCPRHGQRKLEVGNPGVSQAGDGTQRRD
jgi:hypothetical protein